MSSPIKGIKVSQLESNKGREVKNQFIITAYDESGTMHEYFQSYRSIIAHKVYGPNPYIELDARYWDYSTTTGKYRNQFLGEGIEETRKKIDAGVYKLVDLN